METRRSYEPIRNRIEDNLIRRIDEQDIAQTEDVQEALIKDDQLTVKLIDLVVYKCNRDGRAIKMVKTK